MPESSQNNFALDKAMAAARLLPEVCCLLLSAYCLLLSASCPSGVGGLPAGACPRFQGAASVAENHAAQIIPEASNVFRIGCRAVTLGELKELSFFALLGLDPLFHELNDDPVGAEASLLRQAADLARRAGRKAHGLANDFVRSAHGTIIHQNGDARLCCPPAHLHRVPSSTAASPRRPSRAPFFVVPAKAGTHSANGFPPARE